MEQTPVHEFHNPDLLRVLPTTANCIVEVGCSSGALAREYKKINTSAHRYIGIEISHEFARLAERHCDEVYVGSIENLDARTWTRLSDGECWVFGDTLEHLTDPWSILKRIRGVMPANGSIACCIPNAQHWSLQVRLNIGDIRYEESGLLDKTHLRWFTRTTILELFSETGFEVTEVHPRIFCEPQREACISLLQSVSSWAGADPAVTARDAMPLQYVVVAVPKA